MKNIPFSVPSEKIIKARIRQLTFGSRPRCPRCQRVSTVRRSENRYRCSSCRRPFSLTSASWLTGMKLSWPTLWRLLWCFCHKYQPQQAAWQARVSLKTARDWYGRFRRNLPQRTGKLDFLTCADEAYFGKRKSGNQRIVAGVIELPGKEVRLRVVPNVSQDILEGFLVKHVERDSMIYTDSHKSYQSIEWLGFAHDTDNHEQNQLKKTVPIERVWSFAKWHMRRMYHHVWAKNLPEFLCEIEWRFSQSEIFKNPLTFLTETLMPVPSR